MSTVFENPIIPGFAPDPSVVCVDGTFFLVNSSFHVFPGLPIYASNDLSSWKHIGMLVSVSRL
jgi:beta-xylosidase